MKRGGNAAARAFFQGHGVSDMGKTDAKYRSRAAEAYRTHLKQVQHALIPSASGELSCHFVCL